MNWGKFLLYLLIGLIIAIAFIVTNRKIKVFTQDEQYMWGSSMVFFWPLYIFFCVFGIIMMIVCGVLHLFSALLKLITGGYKKNVSSR